MRTHSVCSSTTAIEHPTPNRRNILIIGDVGVGKSSLVNLIAGEERAITSSGARSCTLSSQEHIVHLGAVELALHDTAGLHEAQGQMKKAAYLDAIHQAYALISRLERSGGISLLVFCMKGGRISLSMQQTYSLFVEVLCNRQVPVIIAVTHLEMHEKSMEHWWVENEKDIKEYGLRSNGHACITTTRGYKNIFTDKYEQSMDTVRKVVLQHSDQVAWKEERANWIKRVVLHMRHWLAPRHASALGGGDLRKKLIRKCGFSAEDAELVAQKIEQTRMSSSGDAPEEDRSWFSSEKVSVDSDSCVSLPIVPYAS